MKVVSDVPYECALAVTSQFPFCALPLRLDTYSQCRFNCLYCFAKARGGHGRARGLQLADVGSLERRLARIAAGTCSGVVDEFLAHRQPLHLGGMTDPFIPIEGEARATYRALDLLGRSRYPTIISTKGRLAGSSEYVAHLRAGVFLVQISLSSLDDRLLTRVDAGAPSATERLAMAQVLVDAGVPVACRVQPLLPGREDDAEEVIDACAAVGIRHVAVEHLKVSVESWPGIDHLSSALGIDVRRAFRDSRAERVGREWVLPVHQRLPRVLALRARAWSHGLSFAAADNDLLLLSDGACCCSGADAVPGFENYFRYTYPEAIRRGVQRGQVSVGLLDSAWRPEGTISRYVNSRSRIPAENGRGASIDAYILRNWNGANNGVSPRSFVGVIETGEFDADGYKIYGIDPSTSRLFGRSLDPIRPRPGVRSVHAHRSC